MKIYTSIFLVLLLIPSFSFCQTIPDCSAVTISSATNNGTHTFATYLESDGIINGNDYSGSTIYYPQNTTSILASIIIIPGYFTLESSIQDWGPFLASHGIVCMTIGTNSIFDLVNARKEALQDALISLKAENTRINSPLFNKLDTNRVALGGWSMGGGGAQLAAVEDSTIKAIIALCPWIEPSQASSFLLNQTVPIILFSGQIDATAPPNTHANAHYNYTPNTTDKLIYEISLGGHTVANSPSGGQGEVGRMALSWLKKYLIEDSCHCPLLLDTPVTASDYQTNITCPIYGCTDLLACNYDSLANTDVNNCIYLTSTTDTTECDAYSWNGQTYTASGVHIFVSTNSNGCDSTATLNLTINQSDTSYTTIAGCDSLIWNDTTYASSGTYTYLTTNSTGCDSTATLNLTINNSTTSTTTDTVCNNYTWVINGSAYTSSIIDSVIGVNVAGCTETNILNLIINPSTTSTSIQGTSQIFQGATEPYIPFPSNSSSVYIWGSTLNSIIYTSFSGDSIAINFLAPGNELIYFTETTSDGCIGDTVWMQLIIESPSNINQIQIDDINIYPNPSRGLFNISFTSEELQNLKVRVLNLIGEELMNENLQEFIGEYTKQIYLTQNAKGIYFLEIETNDGIINKKFIFQ